jgi:hypothetical protein
MPDQKPQDPSLDRLKDASRDLKERIEEQKRKQDMPLDSNLGDPEWEAKAKDGRFDKPDEDEE